jgi:outer membrane biosynthesis protein TonB
MKRILTMTLAAALLICALSLPAMAESTETTETTATTETTIETTTETTEAVASATRNKRNNQAAPQQKPGHGQKPGRNGQQQQAPNQNGQQPQTPNQNGQQPQTPERNAPQPQTPGQNGGNRKHDNAKNGRTGKSGAGLDPDQLLKENVISQDVYDAIINYLNSLATLQQSTESSTDSAGTT